MPPFLGPTPQIRIVHKARGVNERGDVSAVCFKTDHPINMKKATWTLTDRFVTCPKCKAMTSLDREPR